MSDMQVDDAEMVWVRVESLHVESLGFEGMEMVNGLKLSFGKRLVMKVEGNALALPIRSVFSSGEGFRTASKDPQR